MRFIVGVLLVICFHVESVEYQRPSTISEGVWDLIEPHLLPMDHPVKKKLDKIFSKPGVNTNGQTLYKAGFRFYPFRGPYQAQISWHPKIKGYYFKGASDSQPIQEEWWSMLARIDGASLIRQEIEDQGYESMFKVPKKWIYLYPDTCSRHFLLVAEDMRTVSREHNEQLWKKKITPEILDALFILITTLGLKDSVYIDNIPFGKNRKIAFIDTEHTLKWPIAYEILNKRLSPKNLEHWKALTGQD